MTDDQSMTVFLVINGMTRYNIVVEGDKFYIGGRQEETGKCRAAVR